MNYQLMDEDEDKISLYGKHLLDLVNGQGNKVVYFSADNATFKANTASLQQSWTNAVFTVSGVAPSLYEALAIQKKKGYKTVEDVFPKQSFTKETWVGMYKGNGTVSDVDGLVAIG
jgi:hypothetical protein